MDLEKWVTLGGFVLVMLTTSWKLHSEFGEASAKLQKEITEISLKLQNEISGVKIILEKLLTKFEQVDKLEKRVERLEKKVFDLDQMDD